MPRKTSLSLSIPEPCHESWQSMLPNGHGRFCNQCQKTVFDFTGLSDAEVARVMSGPNAPTCGRLRNSQLNRPIIVSIHKTHRSWPRLAAGAVVIMMAMPHALLAQAPASTPTAITTNLNGNGDGNPKPVSNGDPFLLKGHLIDAETGEPLAYAIVQILDLGVGALTNEQGFFEITIPLNKASDSLLLEARSEGNVAGIMLRKNDLPSEITIAIQTQLALDIFAVGGIGVDRREIQTDRNTDPEPLFQFRRNRRNAK